MIERIFAIGDIHGCSKTFRKLLIDRIQIQQTDEIYCIGDYIDRGKDSKGIIDFILKLRTEGYHIYTLRGNHEQMMLDSITSDEAKKMWLENGGSQTLSSFGIKSLSELPDKYFSFLNETQLYFRTEKYIFVHAGLNFERDNIFEDKDAMLWIRDFFPRQPALKDLLLIHGHTPKPLKYIVNQTDNCINVDGGCVYKHRAHLGNLVAFDLNERKFIPEKNCE